ncbi:carbohydrate ABC transporter permease [Streptacidiphilus sp. EB103A]|uniref:carbohydrate ABC transporter permease n=1 Tax=Streptacidiphilus sp. EB103A TaxID=3156275 RepID=UPI003516AF7C
MTTSIAATTAARRRNPNRPVWEEPPSAAGQAGKGAVLVVILLVILVPLWSVVITSLSSPSAINTAGGMVLIPNGLSLNAYDTILRGGPVAQALLVSLAITVVGTLFSMVISVLCAYGLSRTGSLGHRTILMLLIVSMFVSAGLIPSYLMVVGLGGYDQYWALIVPSAVNVFNIIVLRAFYAGTATELIDAARMDGASEWRILWSVVLPTSRAVTAVVTLFYAVGYWNSFFNVMLYMPLDSGKWPLQYVLYQYVSLGFNMPGQTNSGFGHGQSQTAPLSLQMAVVVLTLLPVVAAFPFLQKHLAKGMLTGAIKG